MFIVALLEFYTHTHQFGQLVLPSLMSSILIKKRSAYCQDENKEVTKKKHFCFIVFWCHGSCHPVPILRKLLTPSRSLKGKQTHNCTNRSFFFQVYCFASLKAHMYEQHNETKSFVMNTPLSVFKMMGSDSNESSLMWRFLCSFSC